VKQATWQLGIVDTWLSLETGSRDIVLVVNTAADAIEVVKNSDLTTAVPESYVRSVPQAAELEVAELPFRHDKILYKMAWHERTDRDPARVWLRSLLRDIMAPIPIPESTLPRV
jgi:DNA-binding transcriptional LysR family regulator